MRLRSCIATGTDTGKRRHLLHGTSTSGRRQLRLEGRKVVGWVRLSGLASETLATHTMPVRKLDRDAVADEATYGNFDP